MDMVFTWVDGADPVHAEKLAETRRLLGATAAPPVRPVWYRDVGEITYAIRSVIRHAPWVGTIFVLTDGQHPPADRALLNSGKVRVVHHADIIPTRFHPVFDATIIESFLHRIDGLSELFLYHNDDVMFGRAVGQHEFVGTAHDGTPVLRLMTNPGIVRAAIAGMSALSPPFLPRANTFTAGIANACRLLRRLGLAWHRIVYPRHFTHVYRRATGYRIEAELGDALEQARGLHLRTHQAISWITLAASLELHWHGAERRDCPAADRLFIDFALGRSTMDTERLWQRIEATQAKFLCLNNVPGDQAERFAGAMAVRGLGNPPVAG
jgi:hypothetical protein